jgi:hypothetical protein
MDLPRPNYNANSFYTPTRVLNNERYKNKIYHEQKLLKIYKETLSNQKQSEQREHDEYFKKICSKCKIAYIWHEEIANGVFKIGGLCDHIV